MELTATVTFLNGMRFIQGYRDTQCPSIVAKVTEGHCNFSFPSVNFLADCGQ